MKRIVIGLMLLAVGFMGAGCVSYTTLHTATPVETGETELGGSIGFYGAGTNVGAVVGGTDNDTGAGAAGIPYNEYEVRFGAAPNLDIGVKSNLMGIGLDFNYALVNDSAFAFSLDPGVYFNGVGILWGHGFVNLLADVLKTERVTFSVGAKPGYWFAASAGATSPGFYAGGTATLRLDLNDKLALTPGFDIVYPLQNNQYNFAFYTISVGGKFKL